MPPRLTLRPSSSSSCLFHNLHIHHHHHPTKLHKLPQLRILRHNSTTATTTSSSFSSAPPLDRNTPLRILFCGSDHFSATSLNALYREHVKDPTFIESIDVVCRPPKNADRGLKTLKEVPINNVATNLNLPLHHLDTFTHWHPPATLSYNLIIAVSFGRLIPTRILSTSPFGGINVHPSLLPSLRGAAPIYHALLNNHTHTGVTIQTLHPTLLDYGHILLQSQEVPIQKRTTYTQLHDQLALLGAYMLVHTCRERLFLPPISPLDPKYPPSEAPKITKKDAVLQWDTMAAEDVELRAGTLGRVWARLGDVDEIDRRQKVIFSLVEVWIASDEDGEGEGDGEEARVKHAEVEVWEEQEQLLHQKKLEPGSWRYLPPPPGTGEEGRLVVKCKEGWFSPKAIKIEGRGVRNAAEWARSTQANVRTRQIFT